LEDENDDSRPILLSYPFWVAEFHSSPDIVGKHVTISDRVATVIGVLPAGFTSPGLSELVGRQRERNAAEGVGQSAL
jgi:hypothetical protein